MANMVKVKFLQGPCTSTENKFTYANIEKIVSRAAAATSNAAAATGAEAVFSPLAAALSASADAAAKAKAVSLEADLGDMLDKSRDDEVK